MKQKITLSIEGNLLKRARALAEQQGASLGAFLAATLEKLVRSNHGTDITKHQDYKQAGRQAS